MRAIPDGDEPGKLRIRISEKVPVAFGGQVFALGLYGYSGKKFVSTRTGRIIGEFALEAGDQTRNCFCICRRTCSEFHGRTKLHGIAVWNTIAYTNSYSYRDRYSHGYGYGDSHLYADSYSDGHIYADSNGDGDCDSYLNASLNTNSYGNSDCHCYSYRNCYGNSDGDSHANGGAYTWYSDSLECNQCDFQ